MSGASPLRSSTPRIPIAMPAETGVAFWLRWWPSRIWWCCFFFEIFTLELLCHFQYWVRNSQYSIFNHDLCNIAGENIGFLATKLQMFSWCWWYDTTPFKMFLLVSGPTKPVATLNHLSNLDLQFWCIQTSQCCWHCGALRTRCGFLLTILLQPKRLRWSWRKEVTWNRNLWSQRDVFRAYTIYIYIVVTFN